MATKYEGRSAAGEREHHRSGLLGLLRFLGLPLAPLLGIMVAWLIHVWAAGVHVHWGRAINWDVSTPAGTPVVAAILVSLISVVIATKARQFAEHRTKALQDALWWSVLIIGLMFAVGVGVGPSYVWSGLFIICGWAVAALWVTNRLDVTRNDIRAEEKEEKKEGFWDKLGVSRKTKLKATVAHDPETGEPIRVDIEADHDQEVGESADVFRDNLTRIESAAGGPAGMASVAGDPDHANRSRVSVPLGDPFKRPALVGPLSAPRKSIGEWTSFADYANGTPVLVTIGNGIHTPTPTSYGVIGATRSGKTGTETAFLTDWGSRCDWTLLYLNQAKGLQDAAPILPIVGAALIADDERQAISDARVAIKQVKNIMAYRQRQLAAHGVSAWSPRCADRDPAKRPTRVVDGKRVPMDPMPFLTVHIGEADSILGAIGDDIVFVGSKGLSLGVNVGISLQKPDFRSMPTNLRSQIGLWFIHGLMNSDDEEFLISTELRKSGVNPGNWKAKKPGQLYVLGNNLEREEMESTAAKTRFIVGSVTAPDGHPYSFDELNDRFMAEMRRRNEDSASYQMQLDRGSAEATGGWWDEQAAKAADLRTANPAASSTATPQPAEPQTPSILRGKPQAYTTPQDGPQPDDVADDGPDEEDMAEMHEEAANTPEVEGIELYPDGFAADVDLTREPPALPDPDPEDDPLWDPEEEAKPKPKTRAEALEVLAETLDGLLTDEKLRDPSDPEGVIIGPGMVFERSRLRSRPWLSAELAALMEGASDLADRYVLALAEDLGLKNGKYRLRRVTGGAQ